MMFNTIKLKQSKVKARKLIPEFVKTVYLFFGKCSKFYAYSFANSPVTFSNGQKLK